MEIQKLVQYTIVKNSESHWYIYFTLNVGVKIVGRPDLADWKTKICLIVVSKEVEEKVSLTSLESFSVMTCAAHVHLYEGTKVYI